MEAIAESVFNEGHINKLQSHWAVVICLVMDALLGVWFLLATRLDLLDENAASNVLVVQPLELCLGMLYTAHNKGVWAWVLLVFRIASGLLYSYESLSLYVLFYFSLISRVQPS